MNLLLLSNSSLPNQSYLEFACPIINDFLGEIQNGIFIPYAAVGFSYEEYENKVNEAFQSINKSVKSIHRFENPLEALEEADSIIVGGGNTFRLLERCQHFGLIEGIQEKVRNQNIPYIGWSAGSNLAGPAIYTTNDMPIIEPKSFNALGLVNYQINPHYTNAMPEGHKGETRDQRIEEFTSLNPKQRVIAIPEGTYIEVKDSISVYKGSRTAFIFSNQKGKTELKSNSEI